MTQSTELTLGKRIRYYRRRRGLTQRQLGDMVERGEAWVSKVERDLIPVDSFEMLLTLTEILRVRDLSDLTGRAIVAGLGGDAPQHDSAPALRQALHTAPSQQPAEAVPLDELTRDVADAWETYNHAKARYEMLGPMLPNMLATAYQTVHGADGTERTAAVRQTVSLLHLYQIYLRRVGEVSLAQIAADRALTLADELGDPAIVSAAAWNVCCVLTTAGHVEASRNLALETIERYPIEGDARPDHVSAHGALHLQAVIASVRDGDAGLAWRLLNDARDVARRLGDAPDYWHTSFGATNVDMHGVHLASEEGDAPEALHLADSVADDERLPLERRTRYWIEVMHANRRVRDRMGTLVVAQRIMRLSPEEMRWHPMVRAAVADLLEHERPSNREEVRALAGHIGILA